MKKLSHIRAKKHLSQNFLTDENVIRKIINSFDLKKDDHVIEIGPGYGAMTFPIMEIVDSIDVIELDKNLANHIKDHDQKKSINVINEDALSFDFTSLKKKRKIRLIGNLPYHISTPLLFHLLNFSEIFHDFHVMVQKEVADRMVSSHNKKTYGRLSVAIQSRCVALKILDIKPGAFHPKPKVLSSIVKLQSKKPLESKIQSRLDEIIRMAFNQRRKKIRNSLKELFIPEMIFECGIDPNQRAENLSVDDYIKLSEIEGSI